MREKYFIGVDIGGTSVKLAIVNDEGTILHKWETATRKESQGIFIPTDIWNSLESKLTETAIDKDSILGIGAGAPGFVDTNIGHIYEAVNVGWKNFDLAEQLKLLSGLPVFVDNDANLAALGENWKGSGNQAANLIAITLGTGVGGGIIANGSVLNGANGTAGEIGHITVEPGGAPCNCGRNGCLETIASATGIVRQAEETVDRGMSPAIKKHLTTNKKIDARDVFQIAANGDRAARDIITRVADVLGLAIANMATAINPSKIVVGGGVSKAGEQLLGPLRTSFDSYALSRISDACEFVIAQLGNDAGVIGGAFLAKKNLDD